MIPLLNYKQPLIHTIFNQADIDAHHDHEANVLQAPLSRHYMKAKLKGTVINSSRGGGGRHLGGGTKILHTEREGG